MTDKHIETLDAIIQAHHQQCLTAADYAQQIRTKKPQCRFVYTEKMVRNLFVEGSNKTIRCTIHQWWSTHQSKSLEGLVQKAEYFTHFQGHKPRHDNHSDSKRTGSRREPRKSRERQPRKRRAINIEQPSPLDPSSVLKPLNFNERIRNTKRYVHDWYLWSR